MRALLTILVTVALAAGAWWWLAGGAIAVVPPAAAGPAASPPRAPGASIGSSPVRADWDRVQRSLDEIARRLTAIESRLDTLSSAAVSPGASSGRVDAAPAACIDPQQLRRALDEIDQQRLRERYGSMSDAELLAEVQRLQWKSSDVAAADAALQQLLGRNLDSRQRGEALTQLGTLQRQRNDVDAAERTLRGVVDQFGMGDTIGSQAAYQLAWTLGKRDPAAAIGVADALATQAGDAGMRTRARWTAARLAESSGDVARARGDYRALLAEVGGNKEFADVAKDIRYRLEQLDDH